MRFVNSAQKQKMPQMHVLPFIQMYGRKSLKILQKKNYKFFPNFVTFSRKIQ